MGSGASRASGGATRTRTGDRRPTTGGGEKQTLAAADAAPSPVHRSELIPYSKLSDPTPGARKHQPPFVPSSEFPSMAILSAEQLRHAKCCFLASLDSSGQPEPQPHAFDRERLFNQDSVKELDFHAASTPSTYELIRDVLPHLFSACSSSAERLRAIFMWVTNMAPSEDGGDGAQREGTIKYYLRGKDNEHLNFLELFRATCREAGFECRIINGFAKGASFRNDYTLSARSNHAWSSVLVDGLWYLCDVVWSRTTGAGARQDDFYFMTRPEEFIFSHFPDEQRWQLLAKPVSREEFCSMAYARKSLFTNGLKILNQHRMEIPCSGETSLQFSYGGDLAFRVRMYSLDAHAAAAAAPAPTAASLDGYVTTEAYAGALSVRIEPPQAGLYRVELYCQGASDARPALFVVYVVRSALAGERVLENPHNERHIWGPSGDTLLAGLEPASHRSGTIRCPSGAAEIVFRSVASAPVRVTSDDGRKLLYAELRAATAGGGKVDLNGSALLYAKKSLVVVNVKLPSPGKFALTVHVLGSDGKYGVACTYLLVAAEAHPDPAPYPPLECLGLTRYGRGVIRPVSHKVYYFEADQSGVETMEFELKEPDETGRLSVDLTLYAARTGQELQDRVLAKVSNDYWLELSIRFPHCGTYALEIKEEDGEEDEPSLLISYVIAVTLPAQNFQPFPTLTSFWKLSYQLFAPTDSWLLENSVAHFLLSVGDDAAAVVVAVGKQQTALHAEGDTWVGSASTGPGGGLVQLLKRVSTAAAETADGATNTTVEPLASFKVLTASDLREKQVAAQREVERAIAKMRRLAQGTDIADAALNEWASKAKFLEVLQNQRRLVVEKTMEKLALEQERRESEAREMHEKERVRTAQETREKIAKARMSLDEVIATLKLIEEKEAMKRKVERHTDADEESISSQSKVEIPKVIYKMKLRRDSQTHAMLSSDTVIQLHNLVSESSIDQSVEKRKDEIKEMKKSEAVARSASLRKRFRRAIEMTIYQKRVAQRNLVLLRTSARNSRARALGQALGRERLRLAVCSRNKAQIFDAMKQFLQDNAQGVSDALFSKAQIMIKILSRREALLEAMKSKSAELLQKALANASDPEFVEEFPLEKQGAEARLVALRRRAATESALMKLDNAVLMEVINFSKPPKMVHNSIAAAFMLTGTPSAATREWSYCKDFLMHVGMKAFIKKMCDLNASTVSHNAAAEVNNMLSKTNLVHVAELSLAAASIHAWAMDISLNVLASTEEG